MSIPDATGFSGGALRAELPLDGLEAFRLASFNIEYVPQYAPIHWDRDCHSNGMFYLRDGQLRFLGRITSP